MLVDHALSRVQRGLAGVLQVSGPDAAEVFKDHDAARSAHVLSH
jgi:nitrite reductase (NO-forming)